MNHTIERLSNGHGMDREYKLVCSCGWESRTESVMNDYCYTNLDEQQKEHLANPQTKSEPELLSNCCGAPPLGEIHNTTAFCSDCKEHAIFEQPEP